MVAFAIELTHPAHGLRRVEFVTPKTLGLLTDGSITTGRLGSHGWNPEALVFQWWLPREKELSFYVADERRGGRSPAARRAELNGHLVAQGTVKHGDVLRWREYDISVLAISPPSEPERAMVEAARADEAALQVYADWLETQGAAQRAEWARLVGSPLGNAEKARMNALAPRLGGSFRALIARGTVERCNQACAQRWEALPLLDEPCRRQCGQCNQRVTWCEDAESARSVSGPVALDPATPRTPGDLLPRPMPVG